MAGAGKVFSVIQSGARVQIVFTTLDERIECVLDPLARRGRWFDGQRLAPRRLRFGWL
jgi:hypothetical protein